jgi:hypothetical protein
MLNTQSAQAILRCFSQNHATLSDLLAFIIQDPAVQDNTIVLDVLNHPTKLLSTLSEHSTLRQPVIQWALDLVNRKHVKSIQNLTSTRNGWHFNALHTSVEQINDFRLEDMVQNVQTTAPELWTTITSLLSADPKQLRRRISRDVSALLDPGDDDIDEDDEAQYWVGLNEDDIQLADTDSKGPWHGLSKGQQRHAIISLVCVFQHCISL